MQSNLASKSDPGRISTLCRTHDSVRFCPSVEYKKVVDQPCGDAFYVRAMFDRRSEGDGELAFQRDAILFVDCTMYQENLGRWRAWLVDEQSGSKLTCGTIPSKTRYVPVNPSSVLLLE